MEARKLPGIILISVVLSFVVSFLLSSWWLKPHPRTVNSRYVESCLQAFIQHKKDGDGEALKKKLAEIPIEPPKFEKIIDRFLYYRMRQSSLEQAMKLLEAFKAGYKIVPTEVFSRSDTEHTYFSLDAEVLTVFKEKPDLIKEAFGS